MAQSTAVASPRPVPRVRRRRRVGEKISRRTYALSSVGTFGEGDSFRPGVFPGLEIRLADLWA